VRLAPRLFAATLPLLATFAPGRAGAVEALIGGRPLDVDVTNTAVFDYHFNNRNDQNLDVPRQADDFYGEWVDRLNVQASYWRFRLGVRLDAAVFFHALSRDDVAALIADQKPILDAAASRQAQQTGGDAAQIGAKLRSDYANSFYEELHARYRRALYPAKLFLGYSQPGVDVTVGDFYVQLGRGLVFSVRKIDELAVDTTVRGVKVVADHSFGDVRLAGTAFAGQMNPLRVDETSGRRLNGAGSPLFFAFPGAGDMRTYDVVTVPGKVLDVLTLPQPSYLEDTAAGGRIEVGTRRFSVAGNAAVLLRRNNAAAQADCIAKAGGSDTVRAGLDLTVGRCASLYPDFKTTDPSKEHDRIVNVSGSINVPSILGHGDFYFEGAGQQMGAGHYAATKDLAGYALYAAGSVNAGPVSVSLEGKHYRNFFPLSAHIDTQTPGSGAPEFALVTYSQPPTAEPIYAEVVRGGSPGVCVTGGRARIDYRFNREASVYGWLGRYASWSEVPLPIDNGCTISRETQTNTWDAAVGADLGFERGKTHMKAWVGARTTDYADPTNATAGTLAFYHEGYVRYDIVKHLAGPFSLQLQGFHRHRYEPLGPHENTWTEGENYTALQWSPHFAAIFGYEYLVKEQCQPGRSATLGQGARAEKSVCHFVNGGLQWRSAGSGAGVGKAFAQLFDTVGVFVGQRRAALRCVSGVCRQFPPFEGARLEITSRF
jgi:hypothetical protein